MTCWTHDGYHSACGETSPVARTPAMGAVTCKTCKFLVQLEIDALGTQATFDRRPVPVDHHADAD
jgi:hypothetical protein